MPPAETNNLEEIKRKRKAKIKSGPPPADPGDDMDGPPPPPPVETVRLVLMAAPDGFGMDIEDDCSVVEVFEGSATVDAGVQANTIIVSVDGTLVASKGDIIDVITREDAGLTSTFEFQSM